MGRHIVGIPSACEGNSGRRLRSWYHTREIGYSLILQLRMESVWDAKCLVFLLRGIFWVVFARLILYGRNLSCSTFAALESVWAEHACIHYARTILGGV
jgi:hypothetical protein